MTDPYLILDRLDRGKTPTAAEAAVLRAALDGATARGDHWKTLAQQMEADRDHNEAARVRLGKQLADAERNRNTRRIDLTQALGERMDLHWDSLMGLVRSVRQDGADLRGQLAAAKAADAPWLRAANEDARAARQGEAEAVRAREAAEGRARAAELAAERADADANYNADRAHNERRRAEQAEAAITRVRDWIAGEPVTARNEFGNGYREALRDIGAALDGSEPAAPAGQVHLDTTDATYEPWPKEWSERPAESEVTHCCVCGSTHVAYRNYAGQPFCGPCAGCGCGQAPCLRTGINDPGVSAEAADPCAHGCHDAADEHPRLSQGLDADAECDGCDHPAHPDRNCGEQLDGDDCGCQQWAAETETRTLPLELDGATLWAAIRDHAAADLPWWDAIRHRLGRL